MSQSGDSDTVLPPGFHQSSSQYSGSTILPPADDAQVEVAEVAGAIGSHFSTLPPDGEEKSPVADAPQAVRETIISRSVQSFRRNRWVDLVPPGTDLYRAVSYEQAAVCREAVNTGTLLSLGAELAPFTPTAHEDEATHIALAIVEHAMARARGTLGITSFTPSLATAAALSSRARRDERPGKLVIRVRVPNASVDFAFVDIEGLMRAQQAQEPQGGQQYHFELKEVVLIGSYSSQIEIVRDGPVAAPADAAGGGAAPRFDPSRSPRRDSAADLANLRIKLSGEHTDKAAIEAWVRRHATFVRDYNGGRNIDLVVVVGQYGGQAGQHAKKMTLDEFVNRYI